MVEEPVEIIEALIDDILVERPLILNDDRKTIFIDAQGIDQATMRFTSRVFTGQEGDTKEGFEVLFHISLERLFQGDGRTLQFLCLQAVDAKDTDVSHALSPAVSLPPS